MGVVDKYNGKSGNVANFGSGTGITSFLLSKYFENVSW
jgi:tRNA1(Val) A37 N6-methylase TrmN6